jgi:hypothetical protein
MTQHKKFVDRSCTLLKRKQLKTETVLKKIRDVVFWAELANGCRTAGGSPSPQDVHVCNVEG